MGDNSPCNSMPQSRGSLRSTSIACNQSPTTKHFRGGDRIESGRPPPSEEAAKRAMIVQRAALPRFILLYAALFAAFGFSSPFLPAFLASRGLQPEALGLLLGAGTALRLICGLIAARFADARNAFRAELAMFAVLAAAAALLYLPTQ